MDKLTYNNRRNFFKKSATIGVGLGVLPLMSCGTAKNASSDIYSKIPQPCHPQQWKKTGIVIQPDYSLGHRFIQNFNSPAEPLGNGNWKIWFCSNPPKPYKANLSVAIGKPGGNFVTHHAVLSPGEPQADAELAIGGLPDGWQPVQPVHILLKNGTHRVYFWAHGGGVVRYLAADSNDGKRYKVVNASTPCLYHFHDRAVEFVGTTPAGLKLKGRSDAAKQKYPRPANEPVADPEVICNDGTTVYQLEDGSFEMYVISLRSLEKGDPRWAANDNLAGYIRVMDRLISKDGLKWYGRQTVIAPDPETDAIDQQFYYLNVTHTEKGRVGMLGHYRVKDQIMDVEWCFSRDGIHWERPDKNMDWIPRGWPGEGDSLSIYPGTSIVKDGGKWHLFYTGCNYAHNHKLKHGEATSVIMHAVTDSIWKDEK